MAGRAAQLPAGLADVGESCRAHRDGRDRHVRVLEVGQRDEISGAQGGDDAGGSWTRESE